MKKINFGQQCLNVESKTGVIECVPECDFVPRKIHQTYPNKSLPSEIAKNIDYLKSNNLGWSHILHSDEDIDEFILKEYGRVVYGCYKLINDDYGAAKADLFRYLLLYKEGGVYLDIKSSVSVPLDTLTESGNNYIVAQWDNDKPGPHLNWGLHDELQSIDGGEFIQWFIMSSPGHPLLKNLIEKVIRNIELYNPNCHGVGRDAVIRVTGPVAYTLAIAPTLEKYKFQHFRRYSDAGLIYSIYEQPGDDASHKHIFNKHYTRLKAPLTIQSVSKKTVSSSIKQRWFGKIAQLFKW